MTSIWFYHIYIYIIAISLNVKIRLLKIPWQKNLRWKILKYYGKIWS